MANLEGSSHIPEFSNSRLLNETSAATQVGQRLHAVQFRSHFDGRHAALDSDIQTISAACAEVRGCVLLPAVLKTALDVGNYLNAGHRAGAAAGFQIESLLKLKAVRSSTHPGRTLLHFVARQARPRYLKSREVELWLGEQELCSRESRLAH